MALVLARPIAYVRSRQKRRRRLAMAQAPRPVAADFIRIRSARNVASVVFAWTDPETNPKRPETSRIPVTAESYGLDRHRKTMQALPAPRPRVAIAEGLWPVMLSAEERRTLAEARSCASG